MARRRGAVIYLDHHAGTPICPAAHHAMVAALDVYGNPSSVHAAGRAARRLLEEARARVGQALGVPESELTFTSGGTEACQLGVQGLAPHARRLVTTSMEHPAILASVRTLAANGFDVEYAPTPDGVLDARWFEESLRAGDLVALGWVGHETGTIHPVERLALLARERGAWLMVDGCQAVGKLPVDLAQLGATAFALGASKFGGPTGAGALHVARGVTLRPLHVGGGQERGLRAGTPSLVPVVGMGAASDVLLARLGDMKRIAVMRGELERALVRLGARINGAGADRVATCVNASFPGRQGARLVAAFDLEGVAVSQGPACATGAGDPAPAVLAMYPDDVERARSAVRFSLGPETTEADIERTVTVANMLLERKVPE